MSAWKGLVRTYVAHPTFVTVKNCPARVTVIVRAGTAVCKGANVSVRVFQVPELHRIFLWFPHLSDRQDSAALVCRPCLSEGGISVAPGLHSYV